MDALLPHSARQDVVSVTSRQQHGGQLGCVPVSQATVTKEEPVLAVGVLEGSDEFVKGMGDRVGTRIVTTEGENLVQSTSSYPL